MNKCKTLQQMRDFKDMIDGIDEDMLEDNNKLRKFFRDKLSPFFVKVEENSIVKEKEEENSQNGNEEQDHNEILPSNNIELEIKDQ